MTALHARLDPPPCAHDRLTFGCAGCARKRDDAIAAAELAAAPLRRVEMHWEVVHRGVHVVDARVPASWDEDRVHQHLHRLYTQERDGVIDDAWADIEAAFELTDLRVGDEVPAQPQPDPAQAAFDLGGAS